MNENHDSKECKVHSSRPPRFWRRGRLALLLGMLVSVFLAVILGWIWLKGSPRSPDLLAGDRQRLEAFLAAHDYEAFLRLMELQPPAVRAELPAEWLRRYDEIKPALMFTVREASTEDVIDSEKKYEAPLLLLRWSEHGKYLVDVLGEKRKVFDGRTGRLVSIAHEPALLPENDAHWLFGNAGDPKERSLDDLMVRRLCVTFGHNPQYWRAMAKQKFDPSGVHAVVLLIPGKNETILTNYRLAPFADGGMNAIARIDPTRQAGNPVPPYHRGTDVEGMRCYNVWKADALPR